MILKKELTLSFLVLFVVGCATLTELGENKTETGPDKEALYGEAVRELNVNQTTDIDKRYNYLERKIRRILDKTEPFDLAQFTRIKIELDFLMIQNYSSEKVKVLGNNFQQAFAEAEQAAEKKEWGSSLSDRYYSLSRQIEKFSSGETKLGVVEYLEVQKGLNKLDQDGYPVPSKVNELRNSLFQVVLTELEMAIVEFEVPDEEIIEEELEEEVIEPEEVGKAAVEKVVLNQTEEGPRTYVVELIDGGFGTDKISIDVGDTVKWRNARAGRYKVGFVIGNRNCRDLKSKIFKTDESYNWTFTEPQTCWVSDGIYTTQAMKVVVS